jgi:L-methionine (R)-S-oxide reductase
MTPKQQNLLSDFEQFASKAASSKSLMEHIAERLHEEIAYYNWVGFYLVDPADHNFLIVGPFVGSFTPNARIPLARGLCGAAAVSGETVVVNDVTKDTRYLSGSSMVKSEIVVPLFQKKNLTAELDVESYFADTFTSAEQEFVEACAAVVEAHAPKA